MKRRRRKEEKEEEEEEEEEDQWNKIMKFIGMMKKLNIA